MVIPHYRSSAVLFGFLLVTAVSSCARPQSAGEAAGPERIGTAPASRSGPSTQPSSAQPPSNVPKSSAHLDATAKCEGKTLAEWITLLSDSDDLNRSLAADAVAKYGPNAKAAVPGLVGLLKNPDNPSFAAALMALAEIGPVAAEAVDPLIALLQHPKPDVRVAVAGTLWQLGRPAGKAVPKLIAALDDKARTEKERDVIRHAIHELGKYDVRAVFAAVRHGKLTDLDLSFVIDSLAPDDVQAVEGLAEAVKRQDELLTYALGGLKRIGPKAAPALAAVRPLLNHPDPGVRKSAGEVVAAITPAEAGINRPEATQTVAPEAGAGTSLDPAIAAVFGAESNAYKDAGYKGVVLGTPFDDLARVKGLQLTRTDQPWVFASGPAGGEEFIFEAEQKRLVCYTRTYNGGPDDYLDQLVELFGKSNRPVRETVTTTATSVSRRTVFDYTFPAVLARVVFVKTAREAPLGGRPVVTEQTLVAVVDRGWAAATLAANARGKRPAIAWLRAAGGKVRGGDVVLKELPALDGAVGREFSGTVPVRYFDVRAEAENAKQEKGQPLPPVASVEKTVRPGDRERTPVFRVTLWFARYSPAATPKVERQAGVQKGVIVPRTGNTALDYTPFNNLVTELNVALARDAFPPKAGTVEYVRPESGAAFYEWRTADGWTVRCGTADTVTIEWVGTKGL